MKQHNFSSTSVAELDGEDRLKVLETIDQLRGLGVSDDISLPQLVVVGDQSSGKSSLLEGLTELAFPIASELCTRFATQIDLRRSSEQDERITVSIIPGPEASNDADQKAHLEKFKRVIDVGGLNAKQFAKLLDEAAIHMGLPPSTQQDVENVPKRFTDNILKIELAGPQHHHLSVVDVPGLFHNPTKYQTDEDLTIIRQLLDQYMKDKRTIILAVMDARNNLANQEVFRMAREADRLGKRTVGIITKCDAVPEGDEEGVLKIAENRVEQLTHGWFCVKNRSTQDIQNGVTITQRHANEKKFFNTSPWNKLDKARVGIHSLKKFLGGLLYDHIRNEYPGLVDEIRKLVTDLRMKLQELGPPRENTLQQRQYLVRLAGQYQARVLDCLRGNYQSSWEDNDSRKLRMHVCNMNDEFASKLAQQGHTHAFRNVGDENENETNNMDNLKGIYAWIRTSYRQSRGSELPGTVNPSLLEEMFRFQAQAWKKISVEYIEKVDAIITTFNDKIFEMIITDEDIRTGVSRGNARSHHNAKSEAMDVLDQIVTDETCGILQTVNHYYADNLAAMRQDRVIGRLKKIGLRDSDSSYVNLQNVVKAAHLSNELQAIYDIHDILKAYYKVARKRFADNIVMQVVERVYLGPQGPVKYTNPELVGSFSDEILEDIAGENYQTAQARRELSSKLDRFEKALAIAEAARI